MSQTTASAKAAAHVCVLQLKRWQRRRRREAAAGVETAQGAVKNRDHEFCAVGQGSLLAMLTQGSLAPSAWVLASKPLSTSPSSPPLPPSSGGCQIRDGVFLRPSRLD
jgi:hypothetical protein